MADEKDGAVVGLQQLFEQLQGVDVQIVRRLVEHQHIGGAGEQARQQQAGLFAAGEAAHGRGGARGAEKKVAQIAFDVLAALADFDPFAARADEVFQRGIRIELRAHLVKVGHLQAGALAHAAAVGRQLAQDQFEQRAFARAVGADEADFVAAQKGGAKALHHGRAAKGFADVVQLGHDFSAGLAAGHFHAHAAQRLAAGSAGGAQGVQAVDAALRAGAARFHAFAHPDFFLRQQFVGPGVERGFLRQLLFFLRLIGGEVAGVAAQAAPVQLHDARGHGIQKSAVVRDDNHAAFVGQQQLLQPANGGQIQMVGRLVQQQHIRLRHQRLGQRHALLAAARKLGHAARAVQPQLLQGLLHALRPVPAVFGLDAGLQFGQIAFALRVLLNQRRHVRHARAHGVLHGFKALQRRRLRHIGQPQALLHLQRTVIGLFQPGQNFQQRRLARPVAANQPHALALLQGKVCVVKQRQVAKGQLGIKQSQQGHE